MTTSDWAVSWHHGDEVEGCAGHYDWPRVPMDIPDRPRCLTCKDSGEVMHPAWGSRTCPEPTIPCPDCHPKPELPTSTTTKRRRRRRHINQTPVPLDEHGEPIY